MSLEIEQTSIFGPNPCKCGLLPRIINMPNYGPDEQWQVLCDKWDHKRAYGATVEDAIGNYNRKEDK